MAYSCHESPNTLDPRLGNHSSDDSLILDEKNTAGLWADSETEPATFRVNLNGQSSGRSISTADFRGEWFKQPWESLALRSPMSEEESVGVLNNAPLQARLSFSGEDSEVPLLSSEAWSAEVFLEDTNHCHPRTLTPPNKSAWRRLMSATILCLFFMIAEILGGYFAGSTAIMFDAAHLLSDLVGLLVSLSAVWLGQRPPTKSLSFGFHRAEVLGALFSIFVIWVLTGIFVYIAIMRLIYGKIEINADRMMAVAAGGIVINIIMGVVLHGGCQQFDILHSHGLGHHGHSHGAPENNVLGTNIHDSSCGANGPRSSIQAVTYGGDLVSNKRTNINLRAAAIHVLGDLIQSIGVFIAAIVIKFHPSAKVADPICTFLFAIVVLTTTVPLLRDAVMILLEAFPRNISYSHVFQVLCDIPGVKHVHSLHVWSLTVGKHALSVHLAVDPSVDRDVVTFRARGLLQTKFGFKFCTIQIESFDQSTISNCLLCKPPVG